MVHDLVLVHSQLHDVLIIVDHVSGFMQQPPIPDA